MALFQILTGYRVDSESVVLGIVAIAVASGIVLVIDRDGRHHPEEVIICVGLVRVCLGE